MTINLKTCLLTYDYSKQGEKKQVFIYFCILEIQYNKNKLPFKVNKYIYKGL